MLQKKREGKKMKKTFPVAGSRPLVFAAGLHFLFIFFRKNTSPVAGLRPPATYRAPLMESAAHIALAVYTLGTR